MAKVSYRTPGGAHRNSIDDLSGIRYAVVGREKVAVLIRNDDFRCSRCDRTDCKHAQAVEADVKAELGRQAGETPGDEDCIYCGGAIEHDGECSAQP